MVDWLLKDDTITGAYYVELLRQLIVSLLLNITDDQQLFFFRFVGTVGICVLLMTLVITTEHL